VVHKKRAAALGLFGDRFLGLSLGPYEQNCFALCRQFTYESARLAEHFEGFLQVNDVNPVAFPENVLLHFRVPTPRLVTEVNSGLQ
jgi:hypothetical protein